MNDDSLQVHRHDSVLTLTINRPAQRNALSLGLLDELAASLNQHAADTSLLCAVITAAGDKAFAAGGDLKELDAVRSEAQASAMSRRGRAALNAVRQFPLPVIGALNGLALGGGAELALACDLRIGAQHAEIGFLQGQLNVTTAWGGGIDLIATVGESRALELLVSARRIGMDEATALGLVSRVSNAGQALTDCIAEFLHDWQHRSPSVARGYKALVQAQRMALHTRLAATEEQHFVATWTHADHWDAVAAAARARQQARQS